MKDLIIYLGRPGAVFFKSNNLANEMECIMEFDVIRYCVHCGHGSPQKIVHEKDYISDWVEMDGDEVPLMHGIYYVSMCVTCNNLLLYANDFIDEYSKKYSKIELFRKANLLWPNVERLDTSSIPKEIIDIYSEASKIKFLSPGSFVVQIRRALEAICIDQGVMGGRTLHDNLRELTSIGKLPPLLSEVTNVIKVIGNAGAHVTENSICQSHAKIVDDFFKVVLEYLYVAPAKLKKFKEEISTFEFS